MKTRIVAPTGLDQASCSPARQSSRSNETRSVPLRSECPISRGAVYGLQTKREPRGSKPLGHPAEPSLLRADRSGRRRSRNAHDIREFSKTAATQASRQACTTEDSPVDNGSMVKTMTTPPLSVGSRSWRRCLRCCLRCRRISSSGACAFGSLEEVSGSARSESIGRRSAASSRGLAGVAATVGRFDVAATRLQASSPASA